MYSTSVNNMNIGDTLNVQVSSIREKDLKPYFSISSNKDKGIVESVPLIGEITNIIKSRNDQCPYCLSSNIIKIGLKGTEILCQNSTCNAKIFLGAYIHFKDLNQSIFINKASVFGFNGFEFFENLKIGDSYNFIIKDYKENTISLNKNSKYSLKKRVYNVQPSSLVSNSLSQKSFNITNINMFIYFSFLIFNDLTDTSKDLKTKKKYLNISRDLGIHLHHLHNTSFKFLI